MSSKKKTSKESKLSKYLKAPIRILIKAKDLYISTMAECSDRISYGSVMGFPTGQAVQYPTTLPKSFSTGSTRSSTSNEDFRELVRAASTKSQYNTSSKSSHKHQSDAQRIDQVDLLKRSSRATQQENSYNQSPAAMNNNMQRSYSVGIGRIDEEKACDFGADDGKVLAQVFPRCKSHAVGKRSNNGFY